MAINQFVVNYVMRLLIQNIAHIMVNLIKKIEIIIIT